VEQLAGCAASVAFVSFGWLAPVRGASLKFSSDEHAQATRKADKSHGKPAQSQLAAPLGHSVSIHSHVLYKSDISRLYPHPAPSLLSVESFSRLCTAPTPPLRNGLLPSTLAPLAHSPLSSLSLALKIQPQIPHSQSPF